jgi:hypothetical protein
MQRQTCISCPRQHLYISLRREKCCSLHNVKYHKCQKSPKLLARRAFILVTRENATKQSRWVVASPCKWVSVDLAYSQVNSHISSQSVQCSSHADIPFQKQHLLPGAIACADQLFCTRPRFTRRRQNSDRTIAHCVTNQDSTLRVHKESKMEESLQFNLA